MLINPQATFEVTDEAGNALILLAQMDIATEAALAATVRRVCPTGGGVPVQVYTYALLVHCVKGWRGPAFAGEAFSAESLRRLDPNEPLVKQAIRALAEANTPRRLTEAGVESDPVNFQTPTG